MRDAHDWRPGTVFEIIDRPDDILLRPTFRPQLRLSLAEFNAVVPLHEGPPLTLEAMGAAVTWRRRGRQRRALIAADTNVVVRLITRDDVAKAAQDLVVARGLYVSLGVLMESEWVLRGGYRWPQALARRCRR